MQRLEAAAVGQKLVGEIIEQFADGSADCR